MPTAFTVGIDGHVAAASTSWLASMPTVKAVGIYRSYADGFYRRHKRTRVVNWWLDQNYADGFAVGIVLAELPVADMWHLCQRQCSGDDVLY